MKEREVAAVEAYQELVGQVSLSGKCQVFTSRLSWSYSVNRAQEYPGGLILHFSMCEILTADTSEGKTGK